VNAAALGAYVQGLMASGLTVSQKGT
jgi:hypothetical protein